MVQIYSQALSLLSSAITFDISVQPQGCQFHGIGCIMVQIQLGDIAAEFYARLPRQYLCTTARLSVPRNWPYRGSDLDSIAVEFYARLPRRRLCTAAQLSVPRNRMAISWFRYRQYHSRVSYQFS